MFGGLLNGLSSSMVSIVVGSVVAWGALEWGSYRVIRSLHPKLSHVQQRDLAVSVVGFTHAVVASAWALFAINTDLAVLDSRLTLSSPLAVFGLQTSLGYFLWDLMITPFYGYGLPFLFHAVLGVASTSIAASSIVTNWMIRYMLFELSTPFLHIRQYYIQQKITDSLAFFIANWLFLITFIGARGVYGTYITYKTLTVVLPTALSTTDVSETTRGFVVLICVISVCSYTLNQFWLFKIVQTARRRAARELLNRKKSGTDKQQ